MITINLSLGKDFICEIGFCVMNIQGTGLESMNLVVIRSPTVVERSEWVAKL